nr:hypothetical protein [uncultured Gellertiella sp.]
MIERIDLSDEGLVDRHGDIMHEYPDLFHAIRLREYKSRQRSPGGLRLSCVATRLECRSAVSEE